MWVTPSAGWGGVWTSRGSSGSGAPGPEPGHRVHPVPLCVTCCLTHPASLPCYRFSQKCGPSFPWSVAPHAVPTALRSQGLCLRPPRRFSLTAAVRQGQSASQPREGAPSTAGATRKGQTGHREGGAGTLQSQGGIRPPREVGARSMPVLQGCHSKAWCSARKHSPCTLTSEVVFAVGRPAH